MYAPFPVEPCCTEHLRFVINALECNISKLYGTLRDKLKPMPLVVETIRYFFADEVAKELRVSRTTFWRWRAEGKIPNGRLYRGGKMVLFTEEEFAAMREFANRLEPVQKKNRNQLKLFNGVK